MAGSAYQQGRVAVASVAVPAMSMTVPKKMAGARTPVNSLYRVLFGKRLKQKSAHRKSFRKQVRLILFVGREVDPDQAYARVRLVFDANWELK